MTFPASVVKVMIASPSDVERERRVAREVIHEWNAVHAEDRKTVLLPIAWETNATPSAGDRPQEIINKQLLRGSDLLIAVFWTRLGTPTGVSESGTTEEIEEHIKAGKPAMLYFSREPVRLDAVATNQFMALQKFKESLQKRALTEEYESVSEFKEKLSRQLAQALIQHFLKSGDPVLSSGDARPTSQPVPSISAEARDLLKESAQDPGGNVLVTLTFGGLGVHANGRNMLRDPKNPREQAAWRGAVRELVTKGMLEQRDSRGEVFQVTDVGYRAAELI